MQDTFHDINPDPDSPEVKAALAQIERTARLYYEALLGCTVKAVAFEADDYSGDDFPVLLLRRADGSEIAVTVSCDPEGNAPGHLFIDEVQS